ncbi:unnamed protein product [Prorocentrum cordatum]|uniref:AP2/ERF domain-containing protein n=1 Tax=Prorocentrum cordatum TaxID=2364126 RepID=A0ABN9W893_9DINO|nr:unnamed protein product [Polarella glacialis]
MEEDRLGQVRAGSYSPAERQSGVEHIVWEKSRAAWRVQYKIQNGPDQGRQRQPLFRPKDESSEEVEQARLAAVEAMRRLMEEDRLGQVRAGSYSPAERQSGVEHIVWEKSRAAWRVQYKIQNGPDQGRQRQPLFRPKDESSEEVEQARLAAVEAMRRLMEEDRLGQVRAGSPSPAERQSGVKHIVWDKRKTAWCIRYKIQNGPDQGRRKTPAFRPKDESPEEVEQARLAAVQALRRLEEEDRLGQVRAGSPSPSGVKHIAWEKHKKVWVIKYKVQNGPDQGRSKQPTFRPKDESPEEVEQARLAAVEALRRLQEEDRALEPSGSGVPCAGRGRQEVPLLEGLFLVVGDDAQRRL